MQPADPSSFVVTVVPAAPAPETTVADVVIGSLGVAGFLLVLALGLGVVMAAVRLGWQRLHPAVEDHLPPVTALTPESETHPSSRAR